MRARAGCVWLEMGNWKRISQHAMVPLLVPAEGDTRSGRVGESQTMPTTHRSLSGCGHFVVLFRRLYSESHHSGNLVSTALKYGVCGGLTEAKPALMHVHAERGDESQAHVVAQRPGVGVGAEVPAHQRAVDGGVRQHGLSARVKMVDVHRAAVLLQVQRSAVGSGVVKVK